jgi:hypothetical protein
MKRMTSPPPAGFENKKESKMKRTLTLVLMGATLGIGSAVLAAGQLTGPASLPVVSAVLAGSGSGIRPTLVDDDGEGGEKGSWWFSRTDDDDDEGEDCDDDDDDCGSGAAGNAAKAGTVAPPKNGLFTNGTAPVVKSN